MGRTYYAKKGKKTFDINFAGTNILDIIHEKINIGFFTMPSESDAYSYVKFVFSKEQSLESAKALKSMDHELIEKIYELVDGKLWDGTLDEFKRFINDWANFLEKSGGCEAL